MGGMYVFNLERVLPGTKGPSQEAEMNPFEVSELKSTYE